MSNRNMNLILKEISRTKLINMTQRHKIGHSLTNNSPVLTYRSGELLVCVCSTRITTFILYNIYSLQVLTTTLPTQGIVPRMYSYFIFLSIYFTKYIQSSTIIY